MATSNASETMREHMRLTYFNLRFGLGLIALLLPLTLWIGALLRGGEPLQGSMSAYYHTSMRDVFVGALVAMGVFLIAYKGITSKENWALNFAGVFGIGVALFPTATSETARSWVSVVHGVCAVAAFVCLGYVAIFRSSDTLTLMPPEKRPYYKYVYQLIGLAMIVAPPIAMLLVFLAQQWQKTIFAVEAAAVIVFAIYWLRKGQEMRETNYDRLALRNELPEESAPRKDVRLFEVAV